MEKMVSVKLLKPYFIKLNAEYIRIILAYQYFALFIDKKVYHFVPIEGQEILINRKTKQIVNTDTKFAFQKGNQIIYLTIKKLTTLQDFMGQINTIIEPYYEQKKIEHSHSSEYTKLISKLEKQNLKRLIDRSLDENDKVSFERLVKQLYDEF